MPDSPDPVETQCSHKRLVSVSVYRCKDCGVRGPLTGGDFVPFAADAALLLCQQDKDEAIREWRLSQQTEALLQARADASASALQQMTKERDEQHRLKEQALDELTRIRNAPTTWDAGHAAGYRSAEHNFKAQLAASASALTALQQGVEQVKLVLADIACSSDMGLTLARQKAKRAYRDVSALLSSSIRDEQTD